mmetsp:Transcript_31447/g.56978  ORF Transcript_31447/g.56978 Transcript_31447/m.56978 type:complete len:167 (-) Transcript_31447:34-534(-)
MSSQSFTRSAYATALSELEVEFDLKRRGLLLGVEKNPAANAAQTAKVKTNAYCFLADTPPCWVKTLNDGLPFSTNRSCSSTHIMLELSFELSKDQSVDEVRRREVWLGRGCVGRVASSIVVEPPSIFPLPPCMIRVHSFNHWLTLLDTLALLDSALAAHCCMAAFL